MSRPPVFIKIKITKTKKINPIFAQVKVQFKIIKISTILSILGLVFLLLLSPCKIRNFIQAETGVSLTRVLNKSQSTISQSDCQTYETSYSIQLNTQPTVTLSNFVIPKVFSFKPRIRLVREYYIINPSENQLISDVPLYILYQNIKVYS